MNLEEVKATALEEIAEEDFRKAVDKYKEKERARKPWFPWKIIIIRRR
jgi:hypothetical protein